MAAANDRGTSTVDLSPFPDITVGNIESYAQKSSGSQSTTMAYKFFAEAGYLQDIQVVYNNGTATVNGKCYCSMRKCDLPHAVELKVTIPGKDISGRCSCAAGAGGLCHHVVGLGFYLAHCKQMGLKSLPDDLTCTSMQQRCSIPRERKIEQKEVQDYSKFVKSTLYSPASRYGILTQSDFEGLDPAPLISTIVPKREDYQSIPWVATKFGRAPKGSVLSYQQKLNTEYVINEYACPGFPDMPLSEAEGRIQNNVSVCLNESKAASLESLTVTREVAINIESRTVTKSSNNLWQLLRMKRITASKFGLVAKRVSSFEDLVIQLNNGVGLTAAMKRGIEIEAQAASVYACNAKNNNVNIYPSGLIINPKCPWLCCSPDRKVFDIEAANQGLNPFGLLEMKVVQEGQIDFHRVRYLNFNPNTNQFSLKVNHDYHYQVQCQLALTGLSWCDFFIYISDTQYVCTRIQYDHAFFQAAKDKVDTFFFNYFLK